MTSGKQLTPWIIHYGCDGFEPVMYLRPSHVLPLAGYAALTEEVLAEEQFFPSRGPWSPQGGKRIIRVPFGSISLQVLPHGSLQVWAFVDPVILRRSPQRGAEGARRALTVLWERLPHTQRGMPTRIGVRSMTAHADIVGFDLRYEMVPADCDNRTRSRLRAWSDNGRFTGFDCLRGAFKVYDKTAEMKTRRTEGNRLLREDYEALGYRVDMGPIWRVEVAYKAARLRHYGLTDLEGVFRHGTSRVRLLDTTSRGAKKQDRPTHAVWESLSALTFSDPWTAACTPIPALVFPRESQFRLLLGKFLSALAHLAAWLGIAEERMVAALRRVLPSALERWPEARDRFREKVRQIRMQQRGGA